MNDQAEAEERIPTRIRIEGQVKITTQILEQLRADRLHAIEQRNYFTALVETTDAALKQLEQSFTYMCDSLNEYDKPRDGVMKGGPLTPSTRDGARAYR